MLLLLGLTVCLAAACSLAKPGVAPERFRAVDVPRLLDDAMAARRTDGVLLAGVRVVDITPDDRHAWIAGFAQMRKSQGVLDPITARIVYLDDGREAVVLISLDLIGLGNSEVNRLRGLITHDHPRRVHVSSTHNHEGPDTIGYWGPGLLVPLQSGLDRDWLDKSFQAIALGVNEAIRGARPARLAVGGIEVEPAWSSNIWFPHGEGPIDRRLSVIRLETLDGAPLATIGNWACHGETLLGANVQLSADFPGRFSKYVEARGGGTGVFFSGALGGMISPTICRFEKRREYKDVAKRIAWMDQMGDRLAELALQAVKDARRDERPRLAVRSVDVTIPLDNQLFKIMARTHILPTAGRRVQPNAFHSEVGLVKIGGAHLALVPGEAFPSVGRALKDAMLFADEPMVIGLANDELAYIMQPREWDDPRYRYETSMSCGPQTGRLVYEAFLAALALER
jgi:hypothetical protein